MSKKIFVIFILLLILTGCGDQAYLERSVGIYFDRQEEAAESNQLSTIYQYQDGQSSQDKQLKIDIREKLEVEKVMTSGQGSYSISNMKEEKRMKIKSKMR